MTTDRQYTITAGAKILTSQLRMQSIANRSLPWRSWNFTISRASWAQKNKPVEPAKKLKTDNAGDMKSQKIEAINERTKAAILIDALCYHKWAEIME